MKSINILFPHQLFHNSPLLNNGLPIYIVEEYLFFKQYSYHQQKIGFHRASMKFYADYIRSRSQEVVYIKAHESKADIRYLISWLAKKEISTIHYIDPTDNWLKKRIEQSSQSNNINCQVYDNPLFLNTVDDLKSFFKPDKKKFFQTQFYISERKKRSLLIHKDYSPIGGKWSFDSENRKKYPNSKTPPTIQFPDTNKYHAEAVTYVGKFFSTNPGTISKFPIYPISFEDSERWLNNFLTYRFAEFGPYEDAIVKEETILHHSVLTPMLNVGLISPQFIIDETLSFASANKVPLNSLEGFIRQIIGWREFIRGIYEVKGNQQRTTNFWNFKRKIPASFYDGTTGILPIDQTIKKVLKTGYCHHIERLMILGNFMLLCEFDPDEVYKWFMELFIDAYDWVMVPNVYGMSQFADGGLMSTKPYISGSNYLMKMSNYKKGEWQAIWDALFWRFMHYQRGFFLKNPRLSMLVRNFDKMSNEKQEGLISCANTFLSTLSKQH